MPRPQAGKEPFAVLSNRSRGMYAAALAAAVTAVGAPSALAADPASPASTEDAAVVSEGGSSATGGGAATGGGTTGGATTPSQESLSANSTGSPSSATGGAAGDSSGDSGGSAPSSASSASTTATRSSAPARLEASSEEEPAAVKTSSSSAASNGDEDLFEPAPTSPEPTGFGPADPEAGDFDEDGNTDLAVVNLGSENISILLGDGNGGFTPAPTSPVGTGERGPESTVVGDFDDDGHSDLAVLHHFTSDRGTVVVLLGQGDGNFVRSPAGVVTLPQPPGGAALGDFNRDGNEDLAITISGGGAGDDGVAILLGDGNGGFTVASTSPERDVGEDPIDVAVGDFNADGLHDLAVANFSDDSLAILVGDGAGNFTRASTVTNIGGGNEDSRPQSLVVGDFNLDTNNDIAVANRVGVVILLGAGNATFTRAPTSPEGVGGRSFGILIGDFNNDERDDLAVRTAGPDRLAVLLGDATGNFTLAPGSPEPVGASEDFGAPGAIAAGDFDNDGDTDLAVANEADHDVTILMNQTIEPETPAADDEEPAPRVRTAVHTHEAETRPIVAHGGERAELARTGLPLAPLGLLGSLFMLAGTRLRRWSGRS